MDIQKFSRYTFVNEIAVVCDSVVVMKKFEAQRGVDRILQGGT